MAAATSHGQRNYDVFLSFRGEDTRKKITDHLYHGLTNAGINVFRDDEGLQKGKHISTQLKQAIHCSRMSIVVFSKNYASSRWCIEELAEIMECKKSANQIVVPVFFEIEPWHVRHQKGTFEEAFAEHEQRYAEQIEKVATWRVALTEVANLSGYHFTDGYEGELINKIVKEISTQLNVHETQGLPLLTRELEGIAFEGHKKTIWSWLIDDKVTSIGIYGMGGVGKTTLMTHVQNQLLDERNPFDGNIYWVTVSQDCNIDKLQNFIAEKINLKVSDHESEKEKAVRLSHALNDRRKCVIILDDVWNHFDVLRVGIPVSNRCKLILTTRSLDVCRQMQCKKIKVEPLFEKEAWNLFAKELGSYSTEVEQLAKEVARECSGLPLGIITMARSMREVDEVNEWKNALNELRKSKVKHNNMDEEVFHVLSWSYLRLNDLALQKCFLYCALFPEDYEIRRDDLISLLIAEGIIDEEERREDEFNRGHTMLNRLENVCLLEGCITQDDYKYEKCRCVKMHDLIRDMAIRELRRSSTMAALVAAGVELKELTDVKTWTGDLVKVSLMKNYIEEIPDGDTPTCPNLSTLLFRENRKLERIANSFFEQFHKLKVVDFSWCSKIKKLPNSISNLVNLVALLLHKLSELKYVPSLAKLRELKMLDLNGCTSVRELPEGLAKLSKLKYLDLTNTNIEEMPKGLLPELRRLQVLKLPIIVVGREVGRLKKLEVMECAFHHVSDFDEYMKSRTQQSLSKYVFLIGDLYGHWTNYSKTVWLDYSTGEGYDSVALPQDIEALRITECDALKCLFEDFSALKATIQLQSLLLEACYGIESLISTSSCSISHGPPLEKLQLLELNDLWNLHGLIRREDSTATATTSFPSISTFSNLKSITITDCLRLRTLFPPILLPNLHNLEEIKVSYCYGLEEIFATDEGSSSTPFPSNPTLSNLKSISIDHCGRVKKLLPPILLPNLRNLEIIWVRDCEGIAEIFATDEGNDKEDGDVGNISSKHSKLRDFRLQNLPELRSIYNGEVICHSLQKTTLIDCPKLKRMPFPLPQPSLQKMIAYPKKWWASVEWHNPTAKNHLQFLVKYKRYD